MSVEQRRTAVEAIKGRFPACMQNGPLSTIYFRLQERRSIVFTRRGYGPTTSNPGSENFGFLEIFNGFAGYGVDPALHVDQIVKWLEEDNEELTAALQEALIWLLQPEGCVLAQAPWPMVGKGEDYTELDFGIWPNKGDLDADEYIRVGPGATREEVLRHEGWKRWQEASADERERCISEWRDYRGSLPWLRDFEGTNFGMSCWGAEIKALWDETELLWTLLDETCGLVRSSRDVGEPRLLSWDELWQLPRYGD